MDRKNFIFTFLLVVSLLFGSNCKSSSFSFDINGTWDITITYSCGTESTVELTFSGSFVSGDIYLGGLLVGSYTVSDKSVSFSYEALEGMTTYTYKYTGNAIDSDEMEGDVEQLFEQNPKNRLKKALPIKVPVASGKWKGKKR